MPGSEEEEAECPQCRKRKRRNRRMRRWLAVIVLIVAIAALAGIPVYVHPQTDPLRKADAIFILGGYGDRRPYAFSLYQQGWAPNMVISNPVNESQPYSKMWIDRWCKSPTYGSDVLPEPESWPTSTKFCPTPDPPTTLGEARALRQLATEHGWHTVIVVTFRPQISRARYILQRCFSGDLVMVASPVDIPPTRWAYEYVYQTAGFAKALFDDGC